MHDIAHAAADAARVPDFDDVLAKGRRHRARRQGFAVGAAAIAVATIVGVTQVVGGGAGDRAPEPAPGPTEVPSGSAATNIPYWVDGSLQVGAVAITTDLRFSHYAAGTTVVGDTGEEGPSEYVLVVGGDLVPIAESDQLMLPTLSRDGRLFVMLEFTSADSQRLIAWDVETRSEVGSVDVPVDGSRPFQVVGIDQDHRVFLADGSTALMWVPGDDPIPVTGVDPADLGAKPWPGGLAHERVMGGRGIGTSLGDVFGTVDDRGRFREVGRLSAPSAVGTWSPDGDVFVDYVTRRDETLALEFADGRDSRIIDLPGPGFWLPVTWESETQLVMMAVGDQPDPDLPSLTDELARCDVVALTCIRIEEVPDGAVQWAADAGT